MLENGDSISLLPPPYAVGCVFPPPSRVLVAAGIPLTSWSTSPHSPNVQRISEQADGILGGISYSAAHNTVFESSGFSELLAQKPLGEINLFNVDPDFTKPVRTNLLFQSSTHIHQHAIAEHIGTSVVSTSHIGCDVLNLHPPDRTSRLSTFDQPIALSSLDPVVTDCQTVFGSRITTQNTIAPSKINPFEPLPITILSINLTDNSVSGDVAPESPKALRARFRKFVATCTKAHLSPAKYSQSNSTSSNVAMVHTAAKCRKC